MICKVEGCERARVLDSFYCREHLNDLWRFRKPVWVQRAEEQKLPAKIVDRSAA